MNQYLRGLFTPTNKHNSPLLPKSQSASISTQKFLHHLSSLYWGHHSSVCTALSPTPALSKGLVSRALKWVTVATYQMARKAAPLEHCSVPAEPGMPPHVTVWTHVQPRSPRFRNAIEMPQTTALCEVTHFWYGTKPDKIQRGSDTEIAAALSLYRQPPAGSMLIGIQPPFRRSPCTPSLPPSALQLLSAL